MKTNPTSAVRHLGTNQSPVAWPEISNQTGDVPGIDDLGEFAKRLRSAAGNTQESPNQNQVGLGELGDPSNLQDLYQMIANGQNRDATSMAQVDNNLDSHKFPGEFAKQQAELVQSREAQRALALDRQGKEQTAIYDAREREVQAKIEQMRGQLLALARQKQAPQEIENSLSTRLPEELETGAYYDNYYTYIGWLISKLNPGDSSSWLAVGRRKRGFGVGYKATKQIQDTFHHEKSAHMGA